MKFEEGDAVTIILQNPREKIFGILHEVSTAGITVRGLDLNYFDDFIRAVAANEDFLPPQNYFLPMWRVERMLRDEPVGGVLSLKDQFHQRTGHVFSEF